MESQRDRMEWAQLHAARAYARAQGMPFKYHTLFRGPLQPDWLASLPAGGQHREMQQWVAAVAECFPDVHLIDVVNEPLHAPITQRASLGGAGASGWDWVINAFTMAREAFPRGGLLLNDFDILGSCQDRRLTTDLDNSLALHTSCNQIFHGHRGLPVMDDPSFLIRAMQMRRDLGHPLFGTLYHTVALESEGSVLVTADNRYWKRARPYGQIEILQSWSR